MLHNLRFVSRRQQSIDLLRLRGLLQARSFNASVRRERHGPNAPLQLDDSLQDILKAGDMSSLRSKARHGQISPTSHTTKELEVLEFDEGWEGGIPRDEEFDHAESTERKSPRAAFGSKNIGSMSLPNELRSAIERVIEAYRRKPQLQEDARRLFHDSSTTNSDGWSTDYDVSYRSRRQAARHADGDGTAFASIALPAHYSVIYAVLDHLKHRLGPEWTLQHVLDWGSGAGSGLWASLHAFQRRRIDEQNNLDGPQLSESTVKSYLAMDKRDGLTSMAKKLLHDCDVGAAKLRWQRGFSDTEKIARSEGRNTIALSAFHLSSLPTPVARKELIKEMWSSGAEVLVLIDHDSQTGFQSVAEARDYLLRMGKKEFEDSEMVETDLAGCHVVAPCPHDEACPLLHTGPSDIICSFSQRMQRPPFVRKTKNVRAGHEDIGYSYVVIRRGKRPSAVLDTSNTEDSIVDSTDTGSQATVAFEKNVRQEAYSWPRLIFPPLKKSGHIILDSCTAQAQIMRLTIPRSQGKQPYYDARKSSWGDIFPHEPKNPPQIRFDSPHGKSKITTSQNESDIGKRAGRSRGTMTASYDKLAADLKESKKQKRRERERVKREYIDME